MQGFSATTCNPAIDGATFIALVARELGIDPDFTVLKKWMLSMISFFDKTVSESYEMLYQSEYDYYFDSTKFVNFFDFTPKSYHEGIHETIEFLKMKKVV